jgi:hypothetical protein
MGISLQANVSMGKSLVPLVNTRAFGMTLQTRSKIQTGHYYAGRRLTYVLASLSLEGAV